MRKQKLLLYGGTGQIGSRAIQILQKDYQVIAPTRGQVDVTDRDQVTTHLIKTKPDQVLYTVGFTSIDEAINKPGDSFLLNTGALTYITHTANKLKVPVLHLSTEVVFDGLKKDKPYKETDRPNPVSINGTTKRLGELVVLDADPKNCVARLIICYSAHYARKLDIARMAIKKVKNGEEFRATNDQEINPIYVDHLIEAITVLMKNKARGIYHVGATNYTTPYKFAKQVIKKLSLDDSKVLPTTFKEFSKTRPGKRPQHEWLSTSKFVRDFGKKHLHTVEEGIDNLVEDFNAAGGFSTLA